MVKRFLLILSFLLIFNITQAQEYDIITPENASQLERVARLGRDYIVDGWFEDDNTLVVSNYACWSEPYQHDIWQYDVRNMDSPIFQPNIPVSEDACDTEVNRHQVFGYTVNIDQVNSRLTLWNEQRNTMQLELHYLEGEYIWSYQLSRDGRWLAVVTPTEYVEPGVPPYDPPFEKNIGIWDTLTGKRVSIIEYFAPRLRMAFSEDGRYFAVASETLIFWNSPFDDVFFATLYETQTGRQIAQIDNNFPRSASALAFSPDSSFLAVIFIDGRIMLVDTVTGEIIADQHGYGGYITHVQFADEQIITTSGDGHTDWWDIQNLEHQRRDEDCMLIGINHDANIGFCKARSTFYEDRPATLKNLSSGEETQLAQEQLNDDWLLGAVFSPDGRYMLTTSGITGSAPLVWDLETNELATTLNNKNLYGTRNVSFLNDGEYIVANNHGTIWKTETFEIVAELPANNDLLNETGAYSESGDWVAFPVGERWAGSESHQPQEIVIKVWRLSELYDDPDAGPIAEIAGLGYGVMTASPDGRLLALSGGDGTVLVDMENFTEVHRYAAGGLELKFSPDGQYLIHADGICLVCGADESLYIGFADVWAVPNR